MQPVPLSSAVSSSSHQASYNSAENQTSTVSHRHQRELEAPGTQQLTMKALRIRASALRCTAQAEAVDFAALMHGYTYVFGDACVVADACGEHS